MIEAMIGLGRASHELGQADEAVRHLRAAEAMAHEIANPKLLAEAWVELPGDVVRRELATGQSLRAHPRHIGMVDATVAIQVAVVHGTSGHDAYPCAVLSGPGAVWLQSTAEQGEAGP